MKCQDEQNDNGDQRRRFRSFFIADILGNDEKATRGYDKTEENAENVETKYETTEAIREESKDSDSKLALKKSASIYSIIAASIRILINIPAIYEP